MKRYANKVFTPVVLLMLFIFFGIVSLSLRQTAESRTSAAMVGHTQDVLISTSRILSIVTENESSLRGFVITGNPDFLSSIQTTRDQVLPAINNLRWLTRDNPVQQQRIDSLLAFTTQRIKLSDSIAALRTKEGSAAAVAQVTKGDGAKFMDRVRNVTEQMENEENRLLKERKAAHERTTSILNTSIIFILILVTILLSVLLRKDFLAINARQKAELHLRNTEASLQLMTNSIKDYAIVVLDTDGAVVSWNKGAERVFGYAKNEITGKPFSTFFIPADLASDEPARNYGLAKKYGQFESEGLRRKKDGTTFWASMVTIALFNEQKAFSGFSTITRDITESKKTQEDLGFLSRQIEQANDAIYVVDANRKIKTWNRGAESLYGFTRKEVLDKDPNEVLQTALSEDDIDRTLKHISRNDYWSGELQRRRKNGDIISVHSSTSNLKDSNGRVTGYVAVSYDITAQKQLRKQVAHLASLVAQSAEAIISCDTSEKIISWNTGAEKLFGWTADEATGKMITGLGLVDAGRDNWNKAIGDALTDGFWRAETMFTNKNQVQFYGAITGSPIVDESGATTAVGFIVTDISLTKKLEHQLKKSNEELEQRVRERTEQVYNNEQRFRALIENSAEGITLSDAQGRVFYRSPGAFKILGSMPDTDTIQLMHEEDIPVLRASGEEAHRKPGVPVEWRGRMKLPDGNFAWMEGTLTNLLHVKGVNAIVANYRNITKRKLAEEKLKASEKQFRHTLDNMLEGIQIIGFDWRYTYVNEALCKHAKYSREELVGYTVMEKYPGLEGTPLFDIYQRCLEGRESFHMENEFRYPDNSVAWFELSFQPVPEGLFILSVDITDRKKAEERLVKSEQLYRSLFENMLHGFAYCRGIFQHGKLTDYIHLGVNKEFEKVTGLKDVVWKKVSDLIPDVLKSRPIYADLIGRVALEGISEKMELYVEPLKRWLSISLYSPEKEYFVILVDNISARKQNEHRIKKLNSELEERVTRRTDQLKKINEELEAFSYSVSHDLRAPLRAIIGFTAILEDEYAPQLDDEARRITSIIKSNTLRMGRLIDDLLTFSRMGRQDVIKTHINTDEMVKEIIDQPDIVQYTSEKPVKWVIHDLPDIDGDANTLRQVWINLIANAVKYSAKSDAPKVEIGSYEEDGKTIFFVKDNGVGFDEKYKNKLFRVFQRLHSADEFEGTGIGLAIVEKIISKHEGQVWADAEQGKGANFYFSLPAKNTDLITYSNQLN